MENNEQLFRWVKASERLPEVDGVIYGNGRAAIEDKTELGNLYFQSKYQQQ